MDKKTNNNFESHEETVDICKNGGVYVIWDIMAGKAYVGQAKDFSKRNHKVELGIKMDNKELQKAFNAGHELVYYPLCNINAPSKQELNDYEMAYMQFLKDVTPFELYNIQEGRGVKDAVLSLEEEKAEAKNILFEDFKLRFNKTPEELFYADEKEKQDAIDYYAQMHNNKFKDIEGYFINDVFFPNKERMKNDFGCIKNVNGLDLEEFFFSKAGDYIGEQINQILQYETETIKEHGYCLWTLANNAFMMDFIRPCCCDRKKKGKDTYVIFSYTPSDAYADKESNKYSYFIASKNSNKNSNIDKREIKKLQFEEVGEDIYEVPSYIDVTATGKVSCLAFVVSEISILDEDIDLDVLNQYYVIQPLTEEQRKAGIKKTLLENKPNNLRSTKYLKKPDTETNGLFKQDKGVRMKYFIGKLKYPFVIQLNSDSK